MSIKSRNDKVTRKKEKRSIDAGKRSTVYRKHRRAQRESESERKVFRKEKKTFIFLFTVFRGVTLLLAAVIAFSAISLIRLYLSNRNMSNKYDSYRLKSTEDSGVEDEETQSIKDNQKIEKGPPVNNAKILLPPIEISPTEHKLQYAYALWYSRRSLGKQTSIQNYDQNLKLVGRFASVEQFWGLYSHLVRPSDLTVHTDFHLFKVGIKPMWEDEANQKGGKWIVRLRKGLVSRCWENLILAMLGEQFMVGEEICGAVVSIRFQEDIICVWNKTASDVATTARIRDTLRRVLHLPTSASMEYKTHNDSMRGSKINQF